MRVLVATCDFIDPHDGRPVVAGRTFVSADADVARSHPQNFKLAAATGSSGIYRARPGAKRPRRLPERPAWLLETETKSWRL